MLLQIMSQVSELLQEQAGTRTETNEYHNLWNREQISGNQPRITRILDAISYWLREGLRVRGEKSQWANDLFVERIGRLFVINRRWEMTASAVAMMAKAIIDQWER